MTRRHSSQGVTFVEVLIASIILGVMAGAALTIMRIHNRELNQVVAKSRLQMSGEIMMEQLGRDIRGGTHVLAVGETWSQASTYTANTVGEIRIINDTGAVIMSYRVSGNKLQACPAGGAYSNFNTGSNDAEVSTATPFTLFSDREQVSVQLALRLTYKGSVYPIPPRGGLYRCRN